ncbi:hypothetical protein NE237_004396 [Protea cynaroides]|uniref:Uncharacterized protein n=1 Tax=Protea cynaroides TaxID=273540 RepID=A0A9Q0KIT2_9MAGN|nr:hypothetical protein NE237_004396 [Protea cynaroides]
MVSTSTSLVHSHSDHLSSVTVALPATRKEPSEHVKLKAMKFDEAKFEQYKLVAGKRSRNNSDRWSMKRFVLSEVILAFILTDLFRMKGAFDGFLASGENIMPVVIWGC